MYIRMTDLKDLNNVQLENLFLQISLQQVANQNMLNVLFVEMSKRKEAEAKTQPTEIPITLPTLRKPNTVTGSFNSLGEK